MVHVLALMGLHLKLHYFNRLNQLLLTVEVYRVLSYLQIFRSLSQFLSLVVILETLLSLQLEERNFLLLRRMADYFSYELRFLLGSNGLPMLSKILFSICSLLLQTQVSRELVLIFISSGKLYILRMQLMLLLSIVRYLDFRSQLCLLP